MDLKERGMQLHARATRGEALSGEERAALEAWYAQQNQAESTMLPNALPGHRNGSMSGKEIVLDLLRQLPDDASLEQLSEEIAIFAAIRRGEQAADAGQVVSHEEVKKRAASWKTSE